MTGGAATSQDLSRETRTASRYGGPVVSVIIPHYNDLANLERCLGLLAAQTAPRDDFEVIVADNNSDCGLEAVAAVCGEFARVVSAPIQGAGPARNAAVRLARAPYLAFTDADCLPSLDWVANGIRALAGAEMVGGGVNVILNDGERPTSAEAFELVLAFNNERYVKKLKFSSSSNMFVRKDVFEAVGDFRPAVAEDRDWGRRAAAMGYRWRYAPDVLISHPARRDWSELTRKWRRITSEAFALTTERRYGRAYWLVLSWLVMLSPLRDAPKILVSSKLDRFQDRLGALGILLRMRLWRFRESHALLFKLRDDPEGRFGSAGRRGRR